MSDNSKCETGCQVFTGGEIRHHKDCVYYPDSLTKMTDDLRAQLEQTQKERDAFQKAANSNLSHRLSVEARLRIATEALESIAYWKSDARVCCFPVDCHEVLAKLKAEKLPDTHVLAKERIEHPYTMVCSSCQCGLTWHTRRPVAKCPECGAPPMKDAEKVDASK